MKLIAKACSLADIQPWRALYGEEMKCQIVHDALHSRTGFANQYFLYADDQIAGYGSILVGGPWEKTHTVFEFYILPASAIRPSICSLL